MNRSRPNNIVVAERPDHSALAGQMAVTPDDYLEGRSEETLSESLTVINLCRSYQYLSRGYYVSLLADARHQRALPTLRMIEEITNPYAYFMALRGAGVETIEFRVVGGRRVLPKLIVPSGTKDSPDQEGGSPLVSDGSPQGPARYRPSQGDLVEVTSIFGRSLDARFRRHCAAVHKVYPFPLLRIRVYRDEDLWKVGQILPLSISSIDQRERDLLLETLEVRRFVPTPPAASSLANRIAVLMDDDDPYAPSDEDTLDELEKVGERSGAIVERIDKEDLAVLPEYDALFIRTVTGMDHYSFLFAQRAKSLGMPVIDDPQATVRCSNKVYLHELFKKAGLPTPRTVTVSRKSTLAEAHALGFPLIVKQPDGTFSAAVKRASNEDELQTITREMFKRSPLLTLQEYRPTEFDWRVGVLGGSVLYVCKYYMVSGHWQIVSATRGRPKYGRVEAVPRDQAPPAVTQLALDAAALIGDGLFGVDVKETEEGLVIIEINDNPDLWVGEEDGAEGDRLYEALIDHFQLRIRQASGEPVGQ